MVKVGGPVSVRQAHAPAHQVGHLLVGQHLLQLKIRVLGLQLGGLGLPLCLDLAHPLLAGRFLLHGLQLRVAGVAALQVALHLVQLPGRFHAHNPLLGQVLVIFLVLHAAVLHRLDQAVHVIGVHAVGIGQCLGQPRHLRILPDVLRGLINGPLHHLLEHVAVFALHHLAKGSPALLRGLFGLGLLGRFLVLLRFRRVTLTARGPLLEGVAARRRLGEFLPACRLALQRPAAPCQPLLRRPQSRCLHRRGRSFRRTALCSTCAAVSAFGKFLQVQCLFRRIAAVAVIVNVQLHMVRVLPGQLAQPFLHKVVPCSNHDSGHAAAGLCLHHKRLTVLHAAALQLLLPCSLLHLVGQRLQQHAHCRTHNVLAFGCIVCVAACCYTIALVGLHHFHFDHAVFLLSFLFQSESREKSVKRSG